MLNSFLPAGSMRRRAAAYAAAVAAVLVYALLLMPGRGDDPRGTPAAILFNGFTTGMGTALTAVAIVLVYRTIRIINFAQTAMGAAGAILVFEMLRWTPVPFPIALVLGLILGGLIGVVVDLVIGRRFFNAPRLVYTIITIALAGFIAGVSPQITRLPIFPPAESRTIDDTFGALPPGALPLRGFTFEVGNLPIQFGFAHVLAIEVSLVLFVAVAAFFRFTRAGIAVRAMAENKERAALLGISVGALSTIVWAIAGVLSAASITMNGLVTTPGVAAGISAGVLFTALAAGVIGRMQNIPVTAFSAVLISIVYAASAWSYPDDGGLVNAGLLAVVGVALLLQRRAGARSEEGTGVTWQASEEVRGIPHELAAVPSVKLSRRALAFAGVAAVLLFPFVTSTGMTNLGGVIALFAIVALSLVVLTGWSGQVSLGQFAFAAIGAAVGGSLTARVGLPFWIAVPVATVVAGGVAAIVGIPALRLRGLLLAVITFGFALVVQTALFNESYFGWLLPDEVERPTLFFLDFQDERSMYYLSVGALLLSIVVVNNLRRSRTGRILIGARENEANLQSFGIPLFRTKVLAFAISGALAGFGGAIFAHHQTAVSPESFTAFASLNVFLLAVIGGVGSVAGVLLGSAYFQTIQYFFTGNVVLAFLQQFATLTILFAAPAGMISLLARARDSWLRIVAQRHQIVVPSLFADVDIDALENRLIPLSEPMDSAGLAALPPGASWAHESELYQGRGERFMDKLKPAREDREAAAIGAARESIGQAPVAEGTT